MIKLFITDLDGCLLEPMRTPRWEVLSDIRRLNEKSRSDRAIPPLTICTGRPMPYAEAVAQMMGIETPIVFESAGVFHPEGYKISVDGSFSENARQKIAKLKKWLNDEIIPAFDGMTSEFSKLMDAGVIHPDQAVIEEALPRVHDYVSKHYSDFEVHSTQVSINIIAKANNKKVGIKKLCQLYELSFDEVAYIGDSSGDLSALQSVGRSFAPANAVETVKAIAEVMDQPVSCAVRQAYQHIISSNRAALTS